MTLENAFFELMDGVPDEDGKDTNGGKDVLDNPVKRDDIELESIDSKNIRGLWNSPESRAVFYEIVNSEFAWFGHITPFASPFFLTLAILF